MLSQTLIYYWIQFHWQILTTYSGFWLVNILLGKFNTSSKKEMKMIKIQIFRWKMTKKCQESVWKCEVAFFTLNLPQWPVMQFAQNVRYTEKTWVISNCPLNSLIDKKYCFWIWRQTKTPSFNDAIALFVGQWNKRTRS